MTHITETPKKKWTSTDHMRPTQCSVGFLEVEFKMDELRIRAQTPGSLNRYLESHPIPAVLGPDQCMYLTDHHHMGLALTRLEKEWDESDKSASANPFRKCCFEIVKDFSQHDDLTMKKFFSKLEEHSLSHPYDGQGKRLDHIPKSLSDLVDDPYRSLAGLARKAGAYDKVDIPFSEFKWADYYRDKIDATTINTKDLPLAIQKAVQWANDPAAKNLPGYHGSIAHEKLPSLAEIKDRLAKRHGADDQSPDLPVIKNHKHS